MKKVGSFLKNNILELYIILNILWLTYRGFLFASNQIPSFEPYSQDIRYLLIINIIIIIVMNIKKYSFHKIDISILLITTFLIISTVFAYNQITALYGSYGRYEGLYSLLYYLSIFYLSTYCKNKKLIIYTILLTGIIQLFYGICQHNGIKPIVSRKQWASGLTTNPNFYGGYILMCLSLSIGLFIDQNKKITNILFLILSCLFMIGLLISNTLSSLVGLTIVLIFLLIYCIKTKKMIKYFITIISILLVFIITNNMKATSLVKDTVQTKNETVNITKGKADNSYGSGRMYIWKTAIKYIPKYIYHGVGIDGFRYIKNGEPIKHKSGKITVIYDKAHNDYLQILITSGIFSLLSFITFQIIILINGLKNSFINKEIYLLLPIIGYLIHLLFSVSVIEVAPIFYICAGLLIERKERTCIFKRIKKIIKNIAS